MGEPSKIDLSDSSRSDSEAEVGLSCLFDSTPIAVSKNQRKIKSIEELPKQPRGRPRKGKGRPKMQNNVEVNSQSVQRDDHERTRMWIAQESNKVVMGKCNRTCL